ncbi:MULTISPECIES: hypothetical protein [unclassified Frankia]
MNTENLPAEVRDALGRLDMLDVLPTAAHVEVFEEINRRLAGALADLDGIADQVKGADHVKGAGGAAGPGVPVPARSGARPTGGPRPGPGMIRPVR